MKYACIGAEKLSGDLIESQEPRSQFNLAILPSTLKEPEELSNRCVARTRRELSQLNIVDRDIPPTTPADLQTHSIQRYSH